MAGIRMSGLVSGLDTESIIKELMSAQTLKKTNLENSKKKLEWKQDKWKDLNTKIYKFYTDFSSKMKLASTYNSKKATSSNESKVKLTANSNAATGDNKIEVESLASGQYVTGGKLNISGVTNATKLTDESLGIAVGTTFTLTKGTGEDAKTTTVTVDEETTIADLVGEFKKAGVNASFDNTQKRFFISSDSGTANAFTLTSSTDGATEDNSALSTLGLGKVDGSVVEATNSSSMSVVAASTVK